MFDLITIGDCMIDVFHVLDDEEINVVCNLDQKECRLCMTYADKIPVREIHKLVAGNAANNAVAVSRLGARVALYSVVGDDLSGKMIRDKMVEEGVATDYLITQKGAESNYSTVLSYHGERTILVYHSKRSFKLPVMNDTKWLYYTSMPKDGHEAITDDLIRFAQKSKIKIIYQPGTFQLRLGADSSNGLLKVTELLVMNVQEAEGYLQQPAGTTIETLLAGLLSLGPKIVIITDGVKGSYAAQSNDRWFLPTRPEIPRVEATGAGDAYASGLATALMLGRDLPEGMRWGTFNAEGVIQQIGPQAGLLTREMMEHQLSKYPNFTAKKL